MSFILFAIRTISPRIRFCSYCNLVRQTTPRGDLIDFELMWAWSGHLWPHDPAGACQAQSKQSVTHADRNPRSRHGTLSTVVAWQPNGDTHIHNIMVNLYPAVSAMGSQN